jgi:hypothetical protein
MTLSTSRCRTRGTSKSAWVLFACVLLLTACSATVPPPQQPVHVGHPTPAAPGDALAASPLEAALQLESLLGQHAVLVTDMMRGRIRNDEDFGQAANAAIGRNTEDLGALVGTLFGEPASAQFRTIWADHVAALFNYSRGVATGDVAVRADARTALVDFESRLADFFSAASQGRLPADSARTAAITHVDHLLQQADAYAAQDFPRANALYRQGYAHTFELGHTLATTLLPPEQAAVLEQPQWRLRSTLGRLLGEHVALAVAALRAGATTSPDFPAAADALNGNTSDLTAAIGSLFGESAGNQFMSLWADHIDQLVSYSAGVARNDGSRRERAAAELRAFEGRLAAFIEGATGNRLTASVLVDALISHDEMLMRGVDAFAAKDYPQAHDIAYRTYQHMFELARPLSDAFVAAAAAGLPQGGAQTGAGGMAAAPGSR